MNTTLTSGPDEQPPSVPEKNHWSAVYAMRIMAIRSILLLMVHFEFSRLLWCLLWVIGEILTNKNVVIVQKQSRIFLCVIALILLYEMYGNLIIIYIRFTAIL